MGPKEARDTSYAVQAQNLIFCDPDFFSRCFDLDDLDPQIGHLALIFGSQGIHRHPKCYIHPKYDFFLIQIFSRYFDLDDLDLKSAHQALIIGSQGI